MSAAPAIAEAPGRADPEARARASPAPLPAATAALFEFGPDAAALAAAALPPDAATRAIAPVPDLSALLAGPAPPLSPAVQAAIGSAVGTDLGTLALRADAAVDEVLRLAGVEGLVAGNTLLLPTSRSTPDTPEGARLLLAAVRQALEGVAGPVVAAEPLVDPTWEQPPEGVPTAPPPEGPAPFPEVPPPEVPAEAAPEAPAPEPPAPEGPAAEAPAAEPAAPEAPAEASAATGGGGAPVELIMPSAPTAPGPEQQERQARVGGAAGAAAGAAAAHPSAEETTAAARGAVAEPAEETAARARGELAAELGERPPPSPEIVALCERIQTAIRERRPVDEEGLRSADPQQTAQEVGSGLSASVDAEAQSAQEGYDALGNPPAGTPALAPQPVAPQPTTVSDPGIDATRATPDPIPAEDLSLEADAAAVDQRIADSRIERPTTEPIQEPPFTTVREGRAELGEMSQDRTAEVAAQQAEALARAQTGMAELQTQALQSLQASRQATVSQVAGGQQTATGSEEQQRADASRDAQAIFDETREQVTALLTPLGQTAMARWDAGVAILSTEFRSHLDTVKSWVDERHAGAVGAVVEVWDDIAGLPDWITDEYTRAETDFGDGVCELLTEISRDVNAVIAAAQTLIATARTRIDQVFADLPESLRAWAEGERQRFAGQLDGLDQQVEAARTSFIQDVSQRATIAVAEVQAEVEQLREAAKGVIGRVYDALNAFLEDPVKAIIDALLTIVGIPPAAFWALVARIQQVAADIAEDPVNFLNNLVGALKLGFQQFFDNFGTHVIAGFWQWLFSGLTRLGITLPPDMSLGSLVTLALQVMGISWARIRGVLVNHIGEQNVALIEHAWTLVSTLIEKGPQGIFELLRQQLDPANIVSQIVSAAVDYLIETLIKQVALRIIGLLNPAGAVLQAIQLIYTVLVWVFQNAARIFQLVETVVGGIANIIAGNIGGAAAAVEAALASTVPVVIDFLAGLLGLGDLPEKIADVIKRLQAYVLEVVDAVIGFLVARARDLLRALGLGGEEEEEEPGEDTELGEEVTFGGGGESHRHWIADDGTPMVASTPQTVMDKLEVWDDEWRTWPEDDEDRGTADALIDLALGALGAIVAKAEELAAAYEAPAPGEPLPSDDPLESLQRQLSDVLAQLFTLFVGDPTRFLEDIAANLPRHGTERMPAVVGAWDRRILDFQIGNEENDPQLWPQPSPLTGIDGMANAVTASASAHEQLLPYFTTARSERREASTDSFAHHALIQESATHTVRRDFVVALASEAGVKLQQAARANVAAATNVEDGYKQKLLGKIDAIAFNWTASGGTWSLPTERLPDHDRYKPLSIVTSPDGLTTDYHTITGQSFTVRRDPHSQLTRSITGRNLRLMVGRGVTQDSPEFATGQDLNRAHLIANEFGGSGYITGLNLATTSEHYNQVLMRASELEIGNAIGRYAITAGRDKREIEFDLTVELETGALLDATILAEIKADPAFKAEDHPELDPGIVQKIKDGEVSPQLRRVMWVRYTLRLPDGSQPAITPLGEDIWLLRGV